MSDGVVVDAAALSHLDNGSQYMAYLFRRALEPGNLAVWIPWFCWQDLLDVNDTLAVLVAGMVDMAPGQVMIGPPEPTYATALRNYAEIVKSNDPYTTSAALDATFLGWPVLTPNPDEYDKFNVGAIKIKVLTYEY